MDPKAAQPQGWLDYINLDGFLQRFNLSTLSALELLTYGGIGFLIGFMIKRYLRTVITLLLVLFLLVKSIEYLGVGFFVFNWDKFKEITGVAPTDTVDGLLRGWFTWAQYHVAYVVSGVLGFILGTKVG